MTSVNTLTGRGEHLETNPSSAQPWAQRVALYATSVNSLPEIPPAELVRIPPADFSHLRLCFKAERILVYGGLCLCDPGVPLRLVFLLPFFRVTKHVRR